MKRLVVKWREGFCNLPLSNIKRVEDVIEVYHNNEFIGMFDLGAIEMFYISDAKEGMAR